MAMNMRKWGSFAGGLSQGLSGGMQTGNTLANSKQARAITQQEADHRTKMRGLQERGAKRMFGLMTGAMTPEQFYKEQAADYGFDAPDTPAPPSPGAAPMAPAASDNGGYTGPGLAEY